MEAKKADKAKETAKKEPETFSKEQILSAACMRDRKDIAEAVLDNKKRYTMESAKEEIEKFMKGRVK